MRKHKERGVLDYLGHIDQAIERIQRYTQGMNEAQFLRDEMVQDAVIRNIEIVGEAANNVKKSNPDFADRHSDIPWAVLVAMRNRVSHAYHKVDLVISGGRFRPICPTSDSRSSKCLASWPTAPRRAAPPYDRTALQQRKATWTRIADRHCSMTAIRTGRPV